jgi:hypothetical protein
MVLANQNAKLTGPDQGFFVSPRPHMKALGTRLVSALSSSKATGHDRISPKLLKDSTGVITFSLTQIFNQSLLTGVFHTTLRSQLYHQSFNQKAN